MTAGDTPSSEPGRLDRRQLLRGIGLGSAALAFPGVLAACGSSGGSAGTPGTSASAGPAKLSNKDIPSLTWALSTSTIVGLDIASAFEANAQMVQINGLEGLLAVSDQLTLTPLLATSYTYDAAGLKYVFQIRPGVKFWDGTTMTADDVVFSLTRHINP